MRILLLLNPGFILPHSLSHFPFSDYTYAWLKEHPENRLTIITATPICINHPLSAQVEIKYIQSSRHSFNYLPNLRYAISVIRKIKQIDPDWILYDGIDTRVRMLQYNFLISLVGIRKKSSAIIIQSYNRSVKSDEYYFNKTIYKKESLLKYISQDLIITGSEQERDRAKNSFIFNRNDKIICLPDAPDHIFTVGDEDTKATIKQKFTSDCEYFICTAVFNDDRPLIFLLKAFSILKKRLRSNIKLLLTGIDAAHHSKVLKQVNQYRYKSDLVIINPENPTDYYSLIAAAYAQIFPSHELIYPSGIREAAKAGIPVITSNYYAEFNENEDAFLHFERNSIDDLANKMMTLYKDEGLRKKIISRSLKMLIPPSSPPNSIQQISAIFQSKGI